MIGEITFLQILPSTKLILEEEEVCFILDMVRDRKLCSAREDPPPAYPLPCLLLLPGPWSEDFEAGMHNGPPPATDNFSTVSDCWVWSSMIFALKKRVKFQSLLLGMKK